MTSIQGLPWAESEHILREASHGNTSATCSTRLPLIERLRTESQPTIDMKGRDTMSKDEDHATVVLSKTKRALFFLGGSISLGLGVLGIALPLLPTTPFLLLSVACYCRSSERMYRWVMGNRYFGEYIRNYREGKGISLRTKALVLGLLWVTIGYSTFVALNILPAQLTLLAIAFGVTIHIVRLPTFEKR